VAPPKTGLRILEYFENRNIVLMEEPEVAVISAV
jgi:hypothetical protein